MDKIMELRAKIEENLASLRAMLEKADTEERDMTEEEVAAYDALEKDTDKLGLDLERLERLAIRQAAMDDRDEPVHKPTWKRSATPPQEFATVGEFIHSVRFYRDDPRLHYEERGQSMGQGVEGGFALPEQFKPEILQVSPQEAIFRPRSTVIPPGDPPDAKITMPVLNQTSDENVYGGVVVAPVAEGGTKPETDLELKQVSLEPTEIAAHIVVTDKLLRNWTAAGSFLSTQLRKAMIGWEDTAFLTGNGVARPLGILNAPAAIKVNRNTASSIVTADIENMYARSKFGGSYVWIANQTIIPQLLRCKDANNVNIFLFNLASAMQMTLLGVPIVFNERSPVIGSEGDLVLCNCEYYLIKDGSGPFVDSSPHVHFTANKTVIKIFWNVDGKPWLSEPLHLEGSKTNTISPFVILK